jgi:hypothetical protein
MNEVFAELERIAQQIAKAWPNMDAFERARLDRDEGDLVGTDVAPDAVAWVRDDAYIIVWAGNRLDEDMNFPAEVPIGKR